MEFLIWSRESTWFWFLIDPRSQAGMIGATRDHWQLPTEQFFPRLLHERTRVPAPWPFLIDPCADIFGWSFAIMPKMRGLQLSDFQANRSLTRDDRHAIARALARGLTAMHELAWPIVGRYVPESATVEPFVLAQEIKFPLATPTRPAAGGRAATMQNASWR